MAPIATICADQKATIDSSTSAGGIQTMINNVNTTCMDNRSVLPCSIRAPLVVTVVGLPCRGKSLAVHRVARHLCWKGEFARVFDVGDYAKADHLDEIISWFQQGNNIAIIDGMHLTRHMRQIVVAFCNDRLYHHLIVEFNSADLSVDANIREMTAFFGENDKNIDWSRILHEKARMYNAVFETCSPQESPLIKINSGYYGSMDGGAPINSVVAMGVQGALQTSILGVLASPVIKDQVFFFTRHGESEYNVLGRIGGNATLSMRGKNYADRLTRLLTGQAAATAPGIPSPSLIWTSELQRTVLTAQNIPGPRAALKDLNEIDAGICEGLTYEEIQEQFPKEFAWRDQDKLKYRYPHGESYLDLLQRVDGVVQALLTKTNVLVISHQAVLRCVMAYFTGSKPDKVPYINVPLHTLLVVRSHGYDFTIEEVPMNIECVDTYRIQPKNCSAERTDADALMTVPSHFDAPLSQYIN